MFQKKDDHFLFSFKENTFGANFGHTRIISGPRKKPAALKTELLQNATKKFESRKQSDFQIIQHFINSKFKENKQINHILSQDIRYRLKCGTMI